MDWRPVRIQVGESDFETTPATLFRYRDSLLAEMFSSPFPLYDTEKEVHVLPLSICTDKAFEVILDFLRTDEWLICDRRTWREVAEATDRFRLPPPPPLILRNERRPVAVEVLEVTAPLRQNPQRPPTISGATPVSNVYHNSCTMLGTLAARGFGVVAEKTSGNSDANSTTVVLQRQCSSLPHLSQVAQCSSWISLLLTAV